MIKISINNTYHTVPTTAGELSLAQWIKITEWASGDDDSVTALVSALSGMDIDDTVQSASIWDGRIDFDSLLSLRLIGADKESTINVNGQELKPQEVAMLKVSQRIMFQQVLKAMEAGATLESQLAKVLAIGFGEQMHGDTWASNLSLSESIMAEQSAQEVLPIAYFFLRTYACLKRDGQVSRSLIIRYSLMRVVNDFKSTAFGRSLTRWRRAILPSGMQWSI